MWRSRSAGVKVWRCRSADVGVWRSRSAGVKVWRCRSADVRVWRSRSADVRVWRSRSADVRVWRSRSAGVKVWRSRSAGVKVWRCSITAAFLRRTLRRRSREKRLKTLSFLHFWLRNVLRATTACTFSTSQLPKVVRDRQFLTLLTWKCASRHNGVHFFDISTSKSGPTMVCFVHFDLEMCFAPQRRALFRHLNFQKWSETASF